MIRTANSDAAPDRADTVPVTPHERLSLHARRGKGFTRVGPPELTEHVGSVEMRVEVGRLTAQGAERWARRIDALAAWLAVKWQREWIPRRPRGSEWVAATEPPDGLETGAGAMATET